MKTYELTCKKCGKKIAMDDPIYDILGIDLPSDNFDNFCLDCANSEVEK